MTDEFDPPIYESSDAMDFVVAALDAGYEPFHFVSRETLFSGPAVSVDSPSESVEEELNMSGLMVERHGAGKFAVHPETSAELKEYGGGNEGR